MDNQIIKISRKELLLILTKYFKKENEDVSVRIKSEVGSGEYYDDVAFTTIMVTRKIKIYGVENVIKDRLTEADLKTIFSEMLKEDNLEVENIEMVNKIHHEPVFYGSDRCNYTSKFSGIEIRVNPINVKKMSLKMPRI